MDEISIDFSQRDEDKLTILDERMGDLELLGVNFKIVEEENIQINGSGSPPEGFNATQLGFDGLQCPEEFKGFQIRLDFYYPVHKPILRGMAHGFRFKERRFYQEFVTVKF
jgi:hypothetical protein